MTTQTTNNTIEPQEIGDNIKVGEKIETITPDTINTPEYDYGISQNTLDSEVALRNLDKTLSTYISDDTYSASWDGDTNHAPSKNAVYDKLNSMDTTISGKASISDLFLLMGA